LDIDFRQIKAFEAVARKGGFSRASREIGLTQPTLSTHILNLERELGVKLFDRTGRTVTLTPAGKVFARYSGRIMDLCRESIEAVDAFSGQIRGSVHVEASTVPGEYILPRWLHEFHALYPEIHVTLTVNDSAIVLEKVSSGEVPLGITGYPGNYPNLESRVLCEDEVIFICPRGMLPDLSPGPLPLKTIGEIPLIRREKGSGTRIALDKALAEHDIQPDSLQWSATLGSTRAVIEGVLAGLGAAFVSRSTVTREIERGQLLSCGLAGFRIRRNFFLVSNPKKTLSPVADHFRKEFLKAGKNLLKGMHPEPDGGDFTP